MIEKYAGGIAIVPVAISRLQLALTCPALSPSRTQISLANPWLQAPDSCILYLMSRDDALNDLIEFLR
ncbi:MAG TPA: hypothetical protein VN952_12390, partial [Chthoniobacterales bacterium]|nr:hypothetical protein [Chthoniobacterales bacterium]